MAYAAGDVILRDHYNTFATGNAAGTGDNNVANINTVWGVGNGSKGYGQSTTLTAVNAGDTVTATQWSTLIARLNSILTHQAGAGSGVTSPVSGDTIAYLSTLSGKITDAYNNRLNFNSTRGTTTTGSNLDGTWNSTTPTTFQQVRTVTFASADQMRYFFNAGGRINLALTTVSGADNTKESSWTNLLNNGVGTLSMDALTSTRSGSGYTLTTDGFAIGMWDLTTSDQTIFRLTETTAAYNTNYVEVLAKVSGSAGTNGGLGTNIVFTINYNDAAADTAFDASNATATAADYINMTMRTRIDIVKPEVTNLTDVWGTITPSATTN